MVVDAEHGRVVRDIEVAIIGAGPAGLMAAETLARAGRQVTVFERMPSPARKFLMAGRGGLNLTHSEPLDAFLGRYVSCSARLLRAVEEFPPAELVRWANALGQQTYIGSSGRIFPTVMKASPLLRAWLKSLAELGVELKTQQTWLGFDPHGRLRFKDAANSEHIVRAGATVLALGGASWPKLGADGGWVGTLEKVGVLVTPLCASNAGVCVPWTVPTKSRFAGTPLKRIAISTGTHWIRGDIVITEKGLEGGAIYASGPAIREHLSRGRPAALFMDLKPDMNAELVEQTLHRAKHGQSLSNQLRKLLALSPAAISVARECGPLPTTPHDLARHIKAVPLTITGIASIDRAISTAGGIADCSVDDVFMLREMPGVFAAGEMLDWDAPTGGYLLQACFATGVAAAKGAELWLETARASNPSTEDPSTC